MLLIFVKKMSIFGHCDILCSPKRSLFLFQIVSIAQTLPLFFRNIYFKIFIILVALLYDTILNYFLICGTCFDFLTRIVHEHIIMFMNNSGLLILCKIFYISLYLFRFYKSSLSSGLLIKATIFANLKSV